MSFAYMLEAVDAPGPEIFVGNIACHALTQANAYGFFWLRQVDMFVFTCNFNCPRLLFNIAWRWLRHTVVLHSWKYLHIDSESSSTKHPAAFSYV